MTNPTHATLVSGPEARAAVTPKRGDKYTCKACGMEMEVTADCRCNDPNHIRLECCGQPMTKESGDSSNGEPV